VFVASRLANNKIEKRCVSEVIWIIGKALGQKIKHFIEAADYFNRINCQERDGACWKRANLS
jgi:hypothetical protein